MADPLSSNALGGDGGDDTCAWTAQGCPRLRAQPSTPKSRPNGNIFECRDYLFQATLSLTVPWGERHYRSTGIGNDKPMAAQNKAPSRRCWKQRPETRCRGRTRCPLYRRFFFGSIYAFPRAKIREIFRSTATTGYRKISKRQNMHRSWNHTIFQSGARRRAFVINDHKTRLLQEHLRDLRVDSCLRETCRSITTTL